MPEIIQFSDRLEMFQNIVLLYCDANGKRFIGNTSYYNGRGNMDYLSILCKDPLPEDMDIMMGWNWLDDNSPNIILVPEETMETGVEDFLFAHGMEKDWRSIPYYRIHDYTDIEPFMAENPIEKGTAVAFGIPR